MIREKLGKNQSGFGTLIGLVVLVVVVCTTGTAFVLSEPKASVKPINTTTVAPQTAPVVPVPATPAPAPVAKPTPTPAKTTPTQVSRPAPKPAPQPQPTPATAPATKPVSVSISSDGCYVTATGTPGLKLETWSYQGQHGGTGNYTLPESGTLTVTTGAYKDFNVQADVKDGSGNSLATAKTIATQNCPPASAEN